jgi:uncharacterized protein involved in exopolysaccharide biosynthesis
MSQATDEAVIDVAATPAAVPARARRRLRVVHVVALAAAIVAVFAGAAVGYSELRPTVYGAQADIILTPRPELSDAAADRAMVTQTMIVTSDPVLRPVVERTGVPLDRLRDAVGVEIVGRSNVMRITAGDRSRTRAVTLVQQVTEEYLRVAADTPGPAGESRTPAITPALLSSAAPLAHPLQPQPLRALAAGILLGLLVAAAAVVVLVRPRSLTRPLPHWE